MSLELPSLALPPPGVVHVWRFDLDREESCLDLLSADEHAQAARFRFERDARRWIAGRAALRRTLSGYLGTPSEALELETGPWGKPGLPNCPLRFNVSHSGGAALIGFAMHQEVGVDLERLREDFAPEDLAAQVFSPPEQARLRESPLEQRHSAFLSLWTAKEAYVKALGLGLSFPLPRLTLSLLPDSHHYKIQDDAERDNPLAVSVCRLSAAPNFAAAVALQGPLVDVRFFDCCHDPANPHCCSGV